MSAAATPTEKPKFPRADALDVARVILTVLRPICSRIIIAGSLRRQRPMVGDVEVVFVPICDQHPTDLFGGVRHVPQTEVAIQAMLDNRILEKRHSITGTEAWGTKNKLARHLDTGIPIDLFAATEENWWNYVVCRTGGARSNIAICQGAQAKGWKWNPYGEGFSRPKGLGRETHPIHSEEEVFAFAGLEYKEPKDRE